MGWQSQMSVQQRPLASNPEVSRVVARAASPTFVLIVTVALAADVEDELEGQ